VTKERDLVLGAASGAIGVSLFLAGAVVVGDPPPFDAPGAQLASYYTDKRTEIQVSCAMAAAATPFLLWFFATIRSLAVTAAPRAEQAASLAFGCVIAWVAVFLADLTSLAVAALRPENLTEHPELATALHDFEWLSMGAATFLIVAALLALSPIALRDRSPWPTWLGWLALLAAATYALRVGVLFTESGPFAGDGLLGLYLPVGALTGWILVASMVLTLRLSSRCLP
jgi:hypothetical protein